MTLACVRTLHRFGPSIKEILLVSNNSSDLELEAIRQGIAEYENTKVLVYDQPFNYQKINNWAAGQSSGRFLMFLNNDIELVQNSAGVIEKMYDTASSPKLGMTGCLLLYGDGRTIQHAGVHLTPKGLADHIYVGRPLRTVLGPDRDRQKFPYDITRNLPMTAVTGAAQLIEAKKFHEVNGFDEKFIICGGDVDLCIRLNLAGYQTTFVGGNGYLIHKESQSRSFVPIPYSDFYYSYLSYIQEFDYEKGDKYVPLLTQGDTR